MPASARIQSAQMVGFCVHAVDTDDGATTAPQPTITSTTAVSPLSFVSVSVSYTAPRRRKKRSFAVAILPPRIARGASSYVDRNDELIFSTEDGLNVDRRRAERDLLDRHRTLSSRDRVAFANALCDEPIDELDFARLSARMCAYGSFGLTCQRELVHYYFGEFMHTCRNADAYVEIVDVRGVSDLLVEYRLPGDCTPASLLEWGDDEVLDTHRSLLHASSQKSGDYSIAFVNVHAGDREVLLRHPLARPRTRFGLERVAIGALRAARRHACATTIVLCLEQEGTYLTYSLGRLRPTRAGTSWVCQDWLSGRMP